MRINDYEANRLRLLKAIRRTEPVARTQLVQLTGLAAGTISETTAELVQNLILIEEKAATAGSGRPRIHLRLNPDAAYVVGAMLLPFAGLDVCIVNLRGDRLYSQKVELTRADSLADLAGHLARLIDQVIAESPFAKDTIHSVGLGLPALVNSENGTLHWMQTYPIQPFAMAETMSRYLSLPVKIDSSANIVARAEHWFGDNLQMDDFCLLVLGWGTSLAQYSDGMLWSGSSGLNPEFAHTKVVYENGRPCTCGATGCLVTYSGIHGIVSQVCEARGIEVPDFVHLNAMFDEIAQDARKAEPVASRAFARAGQFLGTAMSNHVNFWNPERIIILCDNESLAGLLALPVRAALQQNSLPTYSGQATVDFRVISEEQYSKGAAALVLEQLYRTPKDRGHSANRRSSRKNATAI